MFEQLTKFVQQFGQEVVVENNAVPNQHNDAVMKEVGNSVFSSLQKMASEGGVEQLASLFQGKNAQDPTNLVVKQITKQLSGNLGEKFGINNNDAAGVAGNMIPKILGGLVNKANDPKDSFQMADLIGAISGEGVQTSGIMEVIAKYGTQFGLDQNADGKLDVNDAIAVAKGGGGIGGVLGKFFWK